MTATGTSLWRVAGLSYLQYVNKSASAVRAALKEPARTKALARDQIHLAGFKWSSGVRGDKGKTRTILHAIIYLLLHLVEINTVKEARALN